MSLNLGLPGRLGASLRPVGMGADGHVRAEAAAAELLDGDLVALLLHRTGRGHHARRGVSGRVGEAVARVSLAVARIRRRLMAMPRPVGQDSRLLGT
ncbi:hypothetical protein [Rhodovastum atsumiense]|uniref:Uncharacterized protein n=1 Tax=Rhodovastum atsumiense TaxID=504468 RepID=A0A5M6J1D8_9PROT|nr:hypothetical protein [Rhodovastum atsumiense]KAA5613458.1 hypothetical protein F1189_05210 [Rhodovastum atsumiense]